MMHGWIPAERYLAWTDIRDLKDDSKSSDAQLVSFAERRIGRKLDVLEIRRVQSLPMTPTGKISKAELKKAGLLVLGVCFRP